MTSRSFAWSSVKSCFTDTAPFWNVMIATRSAGVICVSMNFSALVYARI